MITLIPIPTSNVAEVIPLIDKMLNDGIKVDHGRTARNDVIEPLTRGTAILWLGWTDKPEAIVITSIKEYPEFKACVVDLCVGDNRKKWIHLLDQIEEWAAGIGCDRIEIPFARAGWARALPKYKKIRIMLEKRI